ncbi:unnamed protein product [Oikopleura dioica]|uniref:SUN domain-containing protein n=1 Tax=Oikopleura dioica TaxID=34765 RepID=E4XDW7_OIKDI|nr:unnamed protein product [Oikopleura dioica]
MRRARDYNSQHIVQPRRSMVTPAKAQPEKYHGVVRELPRVDLDRSGSSGSSSLNASTLLYHEEKVSNVTLLEHWIKANLKTVISLFACLLIICVAAQLGRFEGEASVEPHYENIMTNTIVPDFSPMQKQLEDLKLMVTSLNEKQEASEKLLGKLPEQLELLQRLVNKQEAQMQTMQVRTTMTPPQRIIEPCDFKDSEERILNSLKDELDNIGNSYEGLQSDFEAKYDLFFAQIGEVSKILRDGSQVASKDSCDSQQAPSLDIGQIMEEKLWQFDADRTGMADFALESAGAEIIPEHTSQGMKNYSPMLSIWKFPVFFQKMSPRIAITPGASPGSCFAFEGGSGTLGIKLSQLIVIQNITLQHIPKETSPVGHIESAPRSFELFSINGHSEEYLGVFEFSNEGKPIQTFQVKRNAIVSAVKFKFISNWGAAHTCIYRTRVHGSLSHNVV